MGKTLIAAISVLFTCIVSPVIAQTTVPFTLTAQQGQNITPIVNGTTLGITATAIGQPVTFTLTGTYTGATTAILSSQAQLVGAADFKAAPISPALPATLAPGKSFTVAITFTPSSAAAVAADLTIPFSESPATAGGAVLQGALVFGLSGTTANLTVNYYTAPSNNVIPLTNGGTLPFPSTLVNTFVSATIVIANGGSAAGTVNSITISGTNNAFQLQGVGLLPTGIASAGTLSFTILYYPSVVGNDTGTLTIQFPSGPFVVNLTGTAVSPSLVYSMINGSTTTPLPVGQPITLPSTNVGSTTSVTIQIQNNGTASSSFNTFGISGSAYSFSSLPIFPVTVAPNSSISFTLNFTPPAPGVFAGTLTIGGTVFTLTGTGLGSQISYSSASGTGPSTTLTAGGTVLFSSVPVAQSTTATVTITSTGTTPATITSIGIVGTAASAYSILNPPSLPTTLAPNASITLTISFTPTVSGLNTATLLVNTTSFTLSGFATSTTASLAAYQITGVSGVVQPFTQPSVGVSLAQAYPVNLTGTLTISVSSTVFAADPSVQFATGGQNIAFTIPANSTKAIFSNGSNSVQFQTGTVAENITLTPTFVVTGGAAISPSGGSPLVLTVPQLAPTLLSVEITSVTTTSITVLVEGYSTTRSLTGLNLQFSSLSPTFTLPTTNFALNVSQSAGFWYSSGGSNAYGGEFAITVPFTTTLAANSTLALANNIAVTATATNSVGTSNSMSSAAPTPTH